MLYGERHRHVGPKTAMEIGYTVTSKKLIILVRKIGDILNLLMPENYQAHLTVQIMLLNITLNIPKSKHIRTAIIISSFGEVSYVN